MSEQEDSSSQTAAKSSCLSCNEMLERVLLSNSNSRAFRLLQSLGATSVIREEQREKMDKATPLSYLTIEIPREEEEPASQSRRTPLSSGATTESSKAATLQATDTTNGSLLRRWTRLLHDSEPIPVSSSFYRKGEAPDRQQLQATSSTSAKVHRRRPTIVDRIQVECKVCADWGSEGRARAFVMGPDPLSIVVCSNRVQNSQEMEELVLHELIHIYDVRKLQLNLKDCESLAYSEVRAAREAECHRRNDKFACTRYLATQATSTLFPLQGIRCVSRVLKHAFQDQRPFQSTPTKDEK